MDRNRLHSLFWRRGLIALLLLGQIYLIGLLAVRGSPLMNSALTVVSVLVCLYIIGTPGKESIKLSWVFLIMLVPIFGGLFFLLLKWTVPRRRKQELSLDSQENRPHYLPHGSSFPEASRMAPEYVPQMRYLERRCGFPVYRNTAVTYLPSGEAKLEAMFRELKQAEHYIFLEYFILAPGQMWDAILEILKEKAMQGVDVRLIYDDMGTMLRLSEDYPQELARFGIRCQVFNPFRPFLSSIQNNRDHRKILSIDGKVAFTGGVNLADEYINVASRFGHWRDAAVMLKGQGAWSLTMMFLTMWNAITQEPVDYAAYCPSFDSAPAPGLVQPYADSPMDDENVGEHVYRQIIENAKTYVYISTPYLIPDETLLSALSEAAKSGIDVRILTPGHWDKRLVHMTTQSYYPQLLKAGVRIYEYTPGFNHAKTFVSDDTVGTVGTVNLDYRSLYLHFECGVWMYGVDAVADMKADFLSTLERSREITLADCRSNLFYRFFGEILHVFAPLM